MTRSSGILVLLGLLAATPAAAQARPIGLVRAPLPQAHMAPRMAMHGAARFGVRPVARPGFAMRNAQAAAAGARFARANTLGSLQRVGLRNGRVPRIGNGFGLFGVGLGLSTAEDLAALPLNQDAYAPQVDPAPAALPRCIRPQIIKIGQGVRRKVRTKVVYGPPTGCTP